MKFKALAMLAMLASAVLITACSGCSSLPAEQDKIAVACDVAATSLQAVTAAVKAGKADKAQLQQAVSIYDAAVIPYCKPIASSLKSPDWAKLEDAMFRLATIRKETQ